MKASPLIVLLFATAGLAAPQPCGFKIAPCRPGTHCIPDKKNCLDLNVCPGHCVPNYRFDLCGGYPTVAKYCSAGYGCYPDPRDPPFIADKPGICLLNDFQGLRLCGGIADGPCPKPEKCYDMKWDECDPDNGGSDCRGICL